METNGTKLKLGNLVSGEYGDVKFTGMISQSDGSGFSVTLDRPIFVYGSARESLWARFDSALRDSLRIIGYKEVSVSRDYLVGAWTA